MIQGFFKPFYIEIMLQIILAEREGLEPSSRINGGCLANIWLTY